MKKKIKKVGNPFFPEGGLSAENINKIHNIHINRALENDGAEDLIPVLIPFSEGKVFEHVGQMKKARDTFRTILKRNPSNKWVKEALTQVEMMIN